MFRNNLFNRTNSSIIQKSHSQNPVPAASIAFHAKMAYSNMNTPLHIPVAHKMHQLCGEAVSFPLSGARILHHRAGAF